MKIYIVFYSSNVWTDIGGIYKTLEEAENEIKKFESKTGYGTTYDQKSVIIERQLDET
jgi:hypothetical protein